jgi:AbrB family looped-hinge helix DNA binding protein
MTWTTTGKVSSKFQLTIPAHIREAMGIRPGDTVRYELGDQGLKIEVVRPDFREVLAAQ